jgi:putative isomerase
MKYKTIIILTVYLSIDILCCANPKKDVSYCREEFKNLVNLQFSSFFTNDNAPTFISDLGAWQIYSQPVDSSEYGSFNGPYFINLGRALLPNGVQRVLVPLMPSKNFAKVVIVSDGKVYDPSKALKATFNYYPGLAEQEYTFDNFFLKLQLIYTDNCSVLIKTSIINTSTTAKNIKLEWLGKLLNGLKASLTPSGNKLELKFSDQKSLFFAEWLGPKQFILNVVADKKQYITETVNAIRIEPKEQKDFYIRNVYLFDKNKTPTPDPVNISDAFISNTNRWDTYINDALSSNTKWMQNEKYRRLAVKSIMVLVSNWRCAAGDLKHDGIMPSITTFDGFWAWDSWKQASACTIFAPELAKSSIRSMYDYQDKAGMIPDCIFSDKSRNNNRNTKPPLSVWAVWNIFLRTKDTAFLKEMYPKMVKYNKWWYKYRDHDKNMLCEFGSTDGSTQAAKWESGMDNAVRFDGATMVKNADNAWSLNQESVDLNSFLYLEKTLLAKISNVLKNNDSSKFLDDATKIKWKINQLMFDKETDYYYDIRLKNKKKIMVMGSEGWTPLWTGVASAEQAAAVLKTISDTTKFNLYLPFPTCSANNNKFDPTGYWRGPVWLDQAAFAIEGLRKYRFEMQADKMFEKLTSHAEGMLTDGALRENYNPTNGKGQGAYHFGWSAAHILMLLTGE